MNPLKSLFSRSRLFPVSLCRRIPLLICLLLLAIIITFGYFSYKGAKQAAVKVGHERLKSLTRQLSNMLSVNAHTSIISTYTLAYAEAVKKNLISDGKDSLAEMQNILQKLKQDTAYVLVQLLNKNHSEIAHSPETRPSLFISLDSVILSSVTPSHDSARVGRFYEFNNTICYPIIIPISENNEVIGYIIRWRKMTATPQTLETFSKLMGSDARFYVGNDDRSLWTDLIKPVQGPPSGLNDSNKVINFSRDASIRLFAAIQPVPGTHWLLTVELSAEKTLASARHFLYKMIYAGIFILIIGLIAAWLISRGLTKPLQQLTTAASEIADGNYSAPVQINRSDELGKLARAFNIMSFRVQRSQAELLKEAEKYRALFEKNPLPMWILSKTSLGIMDVNQAAAMHYGYTKEEFLKLSSLELRPDEEKEKYVAYIASEKSGSHRAGIWKHKRKDGSFMMMDIFTDNIFYKDEPALLVLAQDVTEKLKAEAELLQERISHQKLMTETRIRVQEKEREDLGKELHDNINQLLATSKLYLGMTATPDEKNQQFLTTASGYIDTAIQEIRKLSRSLVAPTLARSTLPGSIKELTETIGIASELTIQLITDEYKEEKIDHDTKLMLYRIVQEQLNNILKHAKAKNIQIQLSVLSETIILIIQDDGTGFDTTKTSAGIGLRNISSRAEFLNGTVQIVSSPGNGCTLEVNIPIRKIQLA